MQQIIWKWKIVKLACREINVFLQYSPTFPWHLVLPWHSLTFQRSENLEPWCEKNQKVPLDVPRAPACRRSFCRTHRPGRSQRRERELQTRRTQWNTQARRPAQHDEMTSSSATTFQLQYFWYYNGGCSKYLQKTAGRRLLHCALTAAQCNVICPVCGFCLCVRLWVCYHTWHDNSKLRASILTKLGL